ncbi:MAG: rRNA metabolism protein [Candidatus Altiarchaeales archaeon WOR_SM1_86-2]|nr:MAG: rRNA metabolism protein [Candidatus Altiarchaeales archaeon WOR_SM1_86-2]
MVSVDKAIIARLKTSGETFEILVDADKALAYRSGAGIDIKDDVLAIDAVFKDASKGDRASEELMNKLFGTTDVYEVADKIIKKGDIQLTTEQKRRMLDERKKRIVNIISRNAINPQTNSPHPPQRIEDAMDEARVHVSLAKSAEEQVESVIKLLRPLLPIKFEKRRVAVKIPAGYSSKVQQVLREFGRVEKEEWAGNYQYCVLEIPAGVQDDFYNKLNNLTHGEVEIKIL